MTTVHVATGTHQGGSLHDGFLTAIRQSHGQLGEVHQHFCHLITPLPTAHINDAVTVTVLGQGLGNDSLATAKGSRNGTRSYSTSNIAEANIGRIACLAPEQCQGKPFRLSQAGCGDRATS